MATLSCNSQTGLLHIPNDGMITSSDPDHASLVGGTTIDSIDLIQGISDVNRQQKLTRSLNVEQILEVSFSKEGERFYKVQWESTWEREDDLVNACKDILRTYWDNHVQFNIILDKNGYPKESTKEMKSDDKENTVTSTEKELETQMLTSQTEPDPLAIFNTLDSSPETFKIKKTPEEESKMNDIPDQYKNVGFAKSVRETFANDLPCENNFDFVEHYLAEKSVAKTKNICKKKPREEMVRDLVSYKNGTRVKCEICSESFADPKSLKSHKICTHDLFSPHQCNICFKKFMKPGDVRRHMASHSPTRAHYCYFCAKTYKTKNHLHRHIKAKHPNLNVSDNDIFEQMLCCTDTDPTDLHQAVMHMTEEEANNILNTETLTSSFNPNNTAMNSFGPLTANTILFQDANGTSGVVLQQQPDLAESFLNPSPDAIQMCLMDKAESFFNCPQFSTVNNLLQT